MTVANVLNSLRVDTLKSIATKAGISNSIIRKPELIESLSQFVTTLAGERHVVVPKKNERAFRNACKKLGYVLPG